MLLNVEFDKLLSFWLMKLARQNLYLSPCLYLFSLFLSVFFPISFSFAYHLSLSPFSISYSTPFSISVFSISFSFLFLFFSFLYICLLYFLISSFLCINDFSLIIFNFLFFLFSTQISWPLIFFQRTLSTMTGKPIQCLAFVHFLGIPKHSQGTSIGKNCIIRKTL